MKVKKICPRCAVEFYVWPSHVKRRKYCSMHCCAKGKIKRTCEFCKKEFYVYPSRLNRPNHVVKFCSYSCSAFKKWKEGRFWKNSLSRSEVVKKNMSKAKQKLMAENPEICIKYKKLASFAREKYSLMREPMRRHNCLNCGKTFHRNLAHGKYCSKKCVYESANRLLSMIQTKYFRGLTGPIIEKYLAVKLLQFKIRRSLNV